MSNEEFQRENIRVAASGITEQLQFIAAELQAVRETLDEGPTAGNLLALTQAVQYVGYIQFHQLILEHAGSVIRQANEDIPEVAFERMKANLIAAGMAKVMPPPFDKALRAAFVASRIAVTENLVDDALKAEAAQQVDESPEEKDGSE